MKELFIKSSQEIDDVSLKEIFDILWNQKLFIILLTSTFTCLSIIYSLSLNNIYTSKIILAPESKGSFMGNSSLAGFAGLAGINIPKESIDKTTIGIETIKSLDFFKNFAQNHNVLVNLMAADKWNDTTQELMINPDIYDEINKKWIPKDKLSLDETPNIQESHEKFLGLLSISQDSKSGLVLIKVDHISPVVAKNWVEWIVKDINELSQEYEIVKSKKAIEYFNEQIKISTINDSRKLLFDLLQNEMHSIMLAKTNPEYLFRVIDSPVIPFKKSKPFRSIIVLSFSFFGFLAASMMILIHRLYFFDKKEN